MKTLLIMRHGKSSWEYDTDDFDRPLNERGKKNASEMGLFIHSEIGKSDVILSSGANRTRTTSILVAENMHFPPEKIAFENKLYLASTKTILKTIMNVSDDAYSCLIVGHNPGLTYLVNYLGVKLDNLPTASVVCFKFAAKSWKKIAPENALFKWLKRAKEL